MQTESYVVLRPFMVEELGLKGSELVAYALIYGFSQFGFGVNEGIYGSQI